MNAEERQAALERARAGDEQALQALLDSFRPYLRVVIHAAGGGQLPARLEATAVLDETVTEAARNFPAFTGSTVAEFTAWLRALGKRSAQHTLHRLRAAVKPAAAPQPEGAVCQEADSGEASQREHALRMAEVLARLPPEEQQVLLLRVVDGLPLDTVADRLGCTRDEAERLFLRALRSLRDACAAEGEGRD